MYCRLFCSCLWIQSVLKLACCNLHSKFQEFDELTADNFTVVVKRDAVSGLVHLKIVTFFALRRQFVLHLVPGSPVLREDFEAHTVDANGRMTRVHVDHQLFYTGYLNGRPQHSVDAAHMDKVWLAQIRGPDDEYSIEPLTHHIPDSPSTAMIVYRHRDIHSSILNNHGNGNATLQPFCEEVQFKQYPFSHSKWTKQRRPNIKNNSTKPHPYKRNIGNKKKGIDNHVTNNMFRKHFNSKNHVSKDNHFKMQYTENHDRWRRSENTTLPRRFDTCDMLAVADFEVFKGIGRGSIFRMVAILVFLYQSIDRMYRDTHFGTFTNLGIALAKIIVHTNYTDSSYHYNMADSDLTAMRTLYAMIAVADFSNYCLVHLSTQRNFGGTLGIATTAEPDSYIWGNGICAKYLSDVRNIGVSTVMNAEGDSLPVVVYKLVIAHEIGHNWGSHHDPTLDTECSPSSSNGGKYIMWAYSGHATSFNAQKFSPCSRREIARTLNAKAHMCFMPRSLAKKICGNNVMDPGEDCDVGFARNDSCCTNNCRFQDQAVCSPFNQPCCTQACQIAPPTQKCFPDLQDCHEVAFCTGTDSQSCSQPKLLPNNATCQSGGKCWFGQCMTFCELLGITSTPARRLVDCVCDKDRTTMCHNCCWDPESNSGCVNLGGHKPNGTPCMLGICEMGFCTDIKTSDDFIFDDKTYFSSRSNYIAHMGWLSAALLAVTARLWDH